MCNWCNDIEGFGLYGVGGTRPRVREAKITGCCNYYIWACRDYYIESSVRWIRDELRRKPKREPDDPLYVIKRGEGLLPFIYTREEEDFYFDEIWKWARRRRLYRLKTSGEGAERSRRESSRGVEEEPIGWPKLYEF